MTVRRHCEAFGIDPPEEVEILDRLAARLALAPHWEYSCKVASGQVFPLRFNLYSLDPREALDLVPDFVGRQQAVAGNSSQGNLCLEVHSQLEPDDLRAVVFGIDIRAASRETRLKVGLLLRRSCPAAETAMNQVAESRAREFRLHEHLLFGFDLRRDGETFIKVYPEITRSDLMLPATNHLVGDLLGPKGRAMMNDSRRLHIAISDQYGELILHFHPLYWRRFARRYLPRTDAVRIMGELYGRVELVDSVVSIPHSALLIDEPPDCFTVYCLQRNERSGLRLRIGRELMVFADRIGQRPFPKNR